MNCAVVRRTSMLQRFVVSIGLIGFRPVANPRSVKEIA
jgi:hypothetical protein